MSYELWKRLEEEEDGETKGRRPEIGHIFLLDRGELCSALLSSWTREDMGISEIWQTRWHSWNPPAVAVNASIDLGEAGRGHLGPTDTELTGW